jgi:hypothetical protein
VNSSASYAEFKRVDNTRVARERDGRRGRELAVLLAAVLPVAAALVAYTGFHLQTVQTGYEIERSRKQVAELQEEQRKLRMRLAADTSPARSEAFAKRENLSPARPGQTFYLAPEPAR